jgi:hypothetical protein
MNRRLKTVMALIATGGGFRASGTALAFPEAYCTRMFTSAVEPVTNVTFADINNTNDCGGYCA